MSTHAISSAVLILALASTALAEPSLVRSAKSGPWSQAATWEAGKVPSTGDKVQIRAGHTVVYDANSDEVIRSLFIVGTLTFAPDRDTRLDVGLIKIEATDSVEEDGFDCSAHVNKPDPQSPRATLLVGTPARPIDAQCQATIRLHHIAGMDAKSCPAIVCCGGRMEFHGSPLNRTWVKLGADVNLDEKGKAKTKPRDSVVVLDEPVSGWKVGDRIVVTGTRGYREAGYFIDEIEKAKAFDISLRDSAVKGAKPDPKAKQHPPVFTEERTITAIDGTRLSVDRPLDGPHQGAGKYRGEVANLSRNVVVESADPDGVRGHTMYHRHSTGSIRYAEFRHLGKENVLGRYSLHFHLCGDTMRGSSVVGASIWDSHNRWITIHGTEYLVVRDCVGYRSVGHGFFLEDGTEVYNVLDRNLAVQAFRGKPLPEQVLPYDPNDGSGFWWANPLNSFTRNVAVECDWYGFHHEVKPVGEPVDNFQSFTRFPKSSVGTDRDPKDRRKFGPPAKPFDLTLPIRQPDGSRKELDIRTLPFVRFDDNEAHSNLIWGVGIGTGAMGVGPDHDHPLVIRNLTIWNYNVGFGVEIPAVKIETLNFQSVPHTSYSFWDPIWKDQHYEHVRFEKVFERRLPGQDKKDGYTLGNRSTYQAGGIGGKRPDEYADLTPVDDLPPITVITQVLEREGMLMVRGTTCENGVVKQVTVNGLAAKSTSTNFNTWEATLPASETVTAHSEDAAGNKEQTPHTIAVAAK
jgi:hypothetical protein